MKTAARKINNVTKVNRTVVYDNIWTFRTQEQMDLFINEMSGQISDGEWESSRNTEWLWSGNSIYRLGEKTELKHYGYEWKKKISYPLSNDLIDTLADRIYTENGFEYGDKKALKAAWKEITEAIKNHIKFNDQEIKEYVNAPRERCEILKNNARIEVMKSLRENSKLMTFKSDGAYSCNCYIDMEVNNQKLTLFISKIDFTKKSVKFSVSKNDNEMKMWVPIDKDFDNRLMEIANFIISF